ncbi:hypothetical protein TCAL_07417 [Tigriopus californicus]|uniref:GRIP domain-containing protein n=1 Tax=Tigriopus californicus TaxID=6832 RepID=A0A553PGJ6_TIGCA|nr:GRIP and coiled-coil domain-containing protein 1-like [Tigriopus californicus]TRY76795.1 hypothetical protein TCAL_07417 [Tigriopus californicus]|eukprot:TCALIF_07417-PA protein Name:"Similar to GCC1 GRIP and coiled-coil domain-containing protein 1 (Homo sapiens)" AED:0.00 eAED:0.00 QI:406/1/1/1/0.5/0.66/3/121/733
MSSGGGDGRAQRRDMLETIEEQKAIISKYENRLRDVVRAYKGLAQEKDALEASLKAIQSPSDSFQTTLDPCHSGSRPASPAPSAASDPDPAPAQTSNAASSPEAAASHQIRTLTSSLATLTREKSRLEIAFQEDRKKHLSEKRERERQLEAVQTEMTQVKTQAQKEVEEVKSKLIVERHGREKDTAQHALMIRELQKLLSDERRTKERLENDLHETRSKLSAVPSASGVNAKYEARIRDLEAQLQDQGQRLTQVQEQNRALSPEVPKLKDEIAALKLNHRRDLERAEARAEAAEDRTVQVRQSGETRVNHLEARLQELSDTIGTYDRLRQHDQGEIERWKEKVSQLEASHRASSVSPSHASEADEFDHLDLNDLIRKFQNLKSALIATNMKSTESVDLDHIFIDPASQKSWQKEYADLKREFDLYKRQIGSPRSRASSLLPEVDQEVIVTLKTKTQDLESRVTSLKKRNMELECENREAKTRVETLEKSIQDLNESALERELAKEQEFKTKYLNVECELQKQRERCLTLIEEKEDEVSMLKSNMELVFQKAFAANAKDGDGEKAAAAVSNVIHSAHGPSLSRKTSRIEASDITDDLHSSIQGDGMVLHYVQEISHKDVELSQLRKQVFDLESTMRELQMNAVAKEERYSEEIEFLSEEVARLKRMTSKEGANMEYLKNVVLNYMLSSEANSRDHMLKAIGAVLIFSPKEMRQIRDYNASWWPQKATQKKKGHR